jgi:hypothetical protein
MSLDRVLRELADLHHLDQPEALALDPQLAAVRAAILLEDALGVVLPDAAIRPEVLADATALRDLLLRLTGRTGPPEVP